MSWFIPTRSHARTASPEPGTVAWPVYKWAIVGMLWFICFFNYADRQAIFSIFPILEKDYGFSKTEQGWIGAAFMWVYALTAPMAGQVGDLFRRKTVILGGLYIWSAITGLTAWCSKLWHFIAVRAAEGLGETFYFPSSMSLISDYHSKQTRSRAMSIHQTSVYAGTIGGGALAGWMADQFDWRYPFVALGIAGIVLGLVLAVFIREPDRNEAERWEAETAAADVDVQQLSMAEFLKHLIRTPTALALICAFFGANFVAMVFLTWMPTFLKEKYSLSLTLSGVGATVFIQIASMLGSVLGGWLADRRSRRWTGGRIWVQSVGLFFGAPFILLCGTTRELRVLVIAMTLFGLCKGLYDANIWASLYDVVPPARRASAVGLMNMIGWIGGSLGPPSIGMAVDHGVTMSMAIASTGAIYLVVAVLLMLAAVVLAPRDIRSMQLEASQE